MVTRLYQGRGYALTVLHFTIQIEDVGQLFFIIFIDNIGRCRTRTLVHTHIEWSIKAEGEPSLFGIEVMTRNAQVGQYTIYLCYAIIAHPIFQITKVATHKGKATVAFGHVLLCISILIKAIEMGRLVEPTQYFAAMSASAEGNIYVDAARLYVESVNSFG